MERILEKLSTSIGTQGATLKVGGCIVEIPPNALEEESDIQLISYYGPRDGTDSITPILSCWPVKKQFSKPIKITLQTCFTIDGDEGVPTDVKRSDDGLEWDDFIEIKYRSELTITFETKQFSYWKACIYDLQRQTELTKTKSIVFQNDNAKGCEATIDVIVSDYIFKARKSEKPRLFKMSDSQETMEVVFLTKHERLAILPLSREFARTESYQKLRFEIRQTYNPENDKVLVHFLILCRAQTIMDGLSDINFEEDDFKIDSEPIFKSKNKIYFATSTVTKNLYCAKRNCDPALDDFNGALLCKMVQHENVVRYFTNNCKLSEPACSIIVMELCITNVEDYVRNQTEFIDKDQRKLVKGNIKDNLRIDPIDIFRQACAGLDHLHFLSIIHRNIKPSNILLTKSGDKVFAKISDYSTKRGSLHYMPKEYFTTVNGVISKAQSQKSDIFSLGLVFYFVLTNGEHAFGKTEKIHQDHVTDEKPPYLSSLDAEKDKTRVELADAIRVESMDLIKQMLQHCSYLRPTAEQVLKHPLFWNFEKKKDFLVDVYNYIKENYGWSVMKDIDGNVLRKCSSQKIHNRLNAYNRKLLSDSNKGYAKFKIARDNILLSAVEKVRSISNVEELLDLLQTKATSPDIPNDEREKLFGGKEGDDKWEVFLQRFLGGNDHLVVHLYQTLKEIDVDDEDDNDSDGYSNASSCEADENEVGQGPRDCRDNTTKKNVIDDKKTNSPNEKMPIEGDDEMPQLMNFFDNIHIENTFLKTVLSNICTTETRSTSRLPSSSPNSAK